MKTLFDPVDYEEIVARVESIKPSAERQWGKMSVSQMLEHAARAVEVAAGKKRLKQALLGRAIGWAFRKDFVGERPFGRNAPSGAYFIVEGEPDFPTAKGRLRALLGLLHALGAQGCDGNIHGFFGKMTGAEWGVTQYKHMDHHLRQFGA